MLKKKLLDLLRAQLKQDLKVAIDAALAAHEAAIHQESKSENEYDSLWVEASHLAGAQSKRACEIKELLAICNQLDGQDLPANALVQSGALVGLKLNGKPKWVLLLPKGGGMNVAMDGQCVQIVTPFSPIGEAILGLMEGDVAQVEVDGGESRGCEILSVR